MTKTLRTELHGRYWLSVLTHGDRCARSMHSDHGHLVNKYMYHIRVQPKCAIPYKAIVKADYGLQLKLGRVRKLVGLLEGLRVSCAESKKKKEKIYFRIFLVVVQCALLRLLEKV